MNKDSLVKKILFFIFVFLGLAFLMAIFYIKRNFVFYDTNPIAQILFHVIVQIDGADPQFIRGIVIQIIICPIIGATLSTILLFSNINILEKIQNTNFIKLIKKYSLLLSLIFFVVSFICIANYLRLVEYIQTYTKSSTLYEESYVDPKNVNLSFPDKKRNLIYIYLESVETSEYSIEQGGGFEECYIPELYELANNNYTFNGNKGYYSAPYANWTTAALVAQSAGIPLNIPIGENDFVTDNKFLPGSYAIGDILEKENYNNVLLIGQESVFGGCKFFYDRHGNYQIKDYTYAVENGLVDPEDFVWWGYEDYKLYEFAKEELTNLASSNQPFNLTMFTIDTHNPEGWVCKYCKDEYSEQLANVYACASRQANEFVEWCKKQDFYENTTIVIAGDHCSMDTGFSNLLSGIDRKAYFTVINPAEGLTETSDRIISTFDLYPTTVASLGIQIEGDRLGLGTNLFSNVDTLCEKYGKWEFFERIKKNSTYYNNHILYGFD